MRPRSLERLQRLSSHLGAPPPLPCTVDAGVVRAAAGSDEGFIEIEGGRVISAAELASACETYRRDGFCHVPAVVPPKLAAAYAPLPYTPLRPL